MREKDWPDKIPEEMVIIKITDTGIGIPREEILRIFERNMQGQHSGTEAHSGTGIGLYLARKYIELHYGNIDVKSEPGKGTEFTITLPLGNRHLEKSKITDKLATGKIDQNEYMKSLGSHVPRNYKIANYIKKSTRDNEGLFVWGDSSIIYALSKRFPPIKYVADYHIRDFSSNDELINALQKKPPSYIVVLPEQKVFTELERFISTNYGLAGSIEEAQIWKLLSPSVRNML